MNETWYEHFATVKDEDKKASISDDKVNERCVVFQGGESGTFNEPEVSGMVQKKDSVQYQELLVPWSPVWAFQLLFLNSTYPVFPL